MTVMGCIADDFTGATDLAGLLARSGASVNLRIGIPSEPPRETADFEVVALKCRTSPVAEAIEECELALEWLRQTGAQRFFWKYCSTFDSTAEGNIGPVADALMQAVGMERCFHCPSFPENGRTVYMGHLFVWNQLLSESPMKDHPLTPMRNSNLVELLEEQGGNPDLIDLPIVRQGPDAVRRKLDEMGELDVDHVVIDAIADEDLKVVAEVGAEMALICGGSAVAMPLPDIYRRMGLLGPADDGSGQSTPEGSAIVLSGSCSAMTQLQVAQFLETGAGYRLDPLALAEQGTGAAKAWLAARAGETAMIYATADPVSVKATQDMLGVAAAGKLVEDALAELAVAARDQGARRFVVAGGETSGAVTKALGVDRLTIGAEIAPGVPWTYTSSDGLPIALALKSGNFGASSFFNDALGMLA